VAILYFLAEEPIQDREQQDCCLIVEVHVPDRVDDQWVQPEAENAIEEETWRGLMGFYAVSRQACSAMLRSRRDYHRNVIRRFQHQARVLIPTA
jgi:hypothetical protein